MSNLICSVLLSEFENYTKLSSIPSAKEYHDWGENQEDVTSEDQININKELKLQTNLTGELQNCSEISRNPSDPYEGSERIRQNNEERIRRRQILNGKPKRRRKDQMYIVCPNKNNNANINPENIRLIMKIKIISLICFEKQFSDPHLEKLNNGDHSLNQTKDENQQFNQPENNDQPLTEVSSMPSDPNELKRRMKQRKDERIRRRKAVKRIDYEEENSRWGKKFQRKYNRKLEGKGGYPGLKYSKINQLKTLKDGSDKTKQNTGIIMPSEQNNSENRNDENPSTGTMSNKISPDYCQNPLDDQLHIRPENNDQPLTEVSCMPSDPKELRRRKRQRNYERIRRQQSVRHIESTKYEEDLQLWDKVYQRKYNKKLKGIGGYPGLTDSKINELKTLKDGPDKLKQNTGSIIPLEQNNNVNTNAENPSADMMSNTISPTYFQNQLDEPLLIQPENGNQPLNQPGNENQLLDQPGIENQPLNQSGLENHGSWTHRIRTVAEINALLEKQQLQDEVE